LTAPNSISPLADDTDVVIRVTSAPSLPPVTDKVASHCAEAGVVVSPPRAHLNTKASGQPQLTKCYGTAV
jgi:hypothetical protein